MAIKIDKQACPQNHRCPLIRVCPMGAISQTGVGLPTIDETKCSDCGKCIRYCGMQAMYLSK